jgi:hypothetical protein
MVKGKKRARSYGSSSSTSPPTKRRKISEVDSNPQAPIYGIDSSMSSSESASKSPIDDSVEGKESQNKPRDIEADNEGHVVVKYGTLIHNKCKNCNFSS